MSHLNPIAILSHGLVAALGVLSSPADAAPPQQDGQPAQLFVERPGSMEFTGVLNARPIQLQDAARLGLSAAEVVRRRTEARALLMAMPGTRHVEATDEYLVEVPAGETENSLGARLIALGHFQYVTPDWRVYPVANCPNDPQFTAQWHHAVVRSCDAWDRGTGSPSVVVTICDTGILRSHPDLLLHRREAINILSGLSESQGGAVEDITGHGTACVGVAAANGDNAVGVAGMGWNLGHRMIRVSDQPSGGAFFSDLTAAARRAADLGDRVVSVSYSGVQDPTIDTAGAYVRSRNALLVYAAGNAGLFLSGARDDNTIVVGATNPGDGRASFSNFGSRVDLVAPGQDIWTTDRSGGYAEQTGTSFACPMVAGVCGVMWSMNPSASPAQIENALRASCDDLGATGTDDVFGFGRINVQRALAIIAPPPSVTLVSTTDETCDAANGAIDISVQNATAVAWTGPAGFASSSVDITGLDAGAYTVTATNQFGLVVETFTVVGIPDITSPEIVLYPRESTVASLPKCWGIMPDLTQLVVVSDDCEIDDVVISQTPPVGTELPVTPNPVYQVTFTARDKAGNQASVSDATITVTGVPNQYYLDADGDSYGDPFIKRDFCAPSSGWVLNSLDCNDGSSDIRPGAPELCNRADDDCNGTVDDGLNGLDYYTDADGDSYGSMYAAAQYACAPVTGKVTNRWDCHDGNPAIRPGATEECDALDNNCDGRIDEDCPDAAFTLRLVGSTSAIAPGDRLEVTASASMPPSAMSGMLARIDFDEAVLRLVSIDPVPSSPFMHELAELVDPATGLVRYEIEVAGTGAAMHAAGELFRMSFEVVSVPEGCDPAALVQFVPGEAPEYSTHFVRASDGVLVAPPNLLDLSSIRFGNVRPVAWGRNDAGQSSPPTDLGSVTAVTAGDTHAGALRTDGTAVLWGSNANGRALGTNASGLPILGVADGTPVKYLGTELAGIAELSAGGSHTLALVDGGAVRAWGLNANGQSTVPVMLGTAAAVAAGQLHSLALRADGQVVGWGYNAYGQCLGTNAVGAAITGAALGTPVRLQGAVLEGVQQISAGAHHSLALRVDGTVRSWGFNQFQQCVVPPGLGIAMGIAGGDYHSVAVRPDGSVLAWGLNASNQCTPPAGLAGVVAVAAGGSHSAAILADGTVVCWGSNTDGQCNAPAAARDLRSIDLGTAYSVALSAPLPAASIGEGGVTDATCTRCNGAIDVTLCNVDSWQWSGPNGFSSTAEDLTNLCPGVYTLSVSGVGGNARLVVVVADIPDTTKPEMTSVPAPRSSNDETDGDCTALVPDFLHAPGGEANYAVSDNCSDPSEITVTQSPAPGSRAGLGANTITFTIRDAAGNEQVATTIFTVTENDAAGGADLCGCGVANIDVYPPARAGAPAGNGIPDCADVTASIRGVDLDGDGSPDVPEYPWSAGYFKVRVRGDFASTWDPANPLFGFTGAQFALRYDHSKLDFIAAVPVPGSGFAGELAEVVDEASGVILYALYSLPQSDGMTANADLIELWFWVGERTSLCQSAGDPPLVWFSTEAVNGFDSKFIRSDAVSTAQRPVLVDLPILRMDSENPAVSVVGVWGEGATDFSLPVDADLPDSARVNEPSLTVSDDCDASPDLQFFVNGTPASSWPGTFPVGTTEVAWTATDSTGRTTTVTRTITVHDWKLAAVAVSFGPNPFPEAATRTVRLSARDPLGAAGLAHQDLTVALRGGVLPAVRVPKELRVADCVTMKDQTHTLRRRSSLAYQLDASGNPTRRFSLVFAEDTRLVQGDSNDDNRVDITDYGLWIIDRSSAANPIAARDARSNFDGDACVNNADFAFLAAEGIHFSTGDQPCGSSSAQGPEPRSRVSLKQLRREGLGELAAADLNGDGWLDSRDLQIVLQGGGGAMPTAE